MKHPLAADMTDTEFALVQDGGLARGVFVPTSNEARNDIGGDELAKWALYSDLNGYFAAVEIKVTGRKVRQFDGAWGVKVRVRFTDGWASGVLIERGGAYSGRLESLLAGRLI